MLENLKEIYPEQPVGRAQDLTNKKFGKWTVLYRTISSSKIPYWLCQCECGTIKPVDSVSLTHGRSQSCGCLTKIDKVQNYEKSQIGLKIGHWTIIKRGNKDKKTWICQCDCERHTIKEMRKDSMAQSNGCEYCSTAKNKLQDLTNQKFGHWTVLYKGPVNGSHIMWHCQCDCEAHTERDIDGYKLRSGKSLSCGCDNRSNGERAIAYLLNNNNIPYIQEKTFDSCKIKKYGKLRFDFYIDNKYLIEFDGEQHFKQNNFFDNLEEIQQRDKEKNE